MAKSTAIEAEINRKRIIDAAAHIALTKGVDRVTLGSVANAVNMSRSGVENHLGSKENTYELIRPALQEEIIRGLKLYTPDTVKQSWIGSLDRDSFYLAAITIGKVIPPKNIIKMIHNTVAGTTIEEARALVALCIGETIMKDRA